MHAFLSPGFPPTSAILTLATLELVACGAKNIRPAVWQVRWPESISSQVKSPSNPTGTLSINNLEAAAFVLQFLVLEQLVDDLQHDHVAIWCDTNPQSAGHANFPRVAERLAGT